MKFQLVLSLLLLIAVPVEAIVDISFGVNFKGASEGVESTADPSDCNGTIGPAHFVEFVNGSIAVYNRTNGVRISVSNDLVFWKGLGITFGANANVSDPRLIYDPSSARWFATQIDFTDTTSNNRFLLAVSKTSDPTAGWRATAIPADTLSGRFADFDTLGLDANAIYLGADIFDVNENYLGVQYITIAKTDLLGTSLNTSRRVSSGVLSASNHGNTPHPVVNLGGTSSGMILSTEDNGYDNAPHTSLKLVTVNNSGTAAASFSVPTSITVPAYRIPINPPQPDVTVADLDSGDCRISAKPYRVGNIIYAAHTVDLPNGSSHHSAIQWFRIDATNKTLIQSGTISNALHLFYPSICANSNGVVVLNVNGSSTNQYVSSYAVVGLTTSNITTFGEPILMKAGTASYDDGFGGTSRWGDYSAITPDPNNSDHFWAIQNIATGTRQWSTYVTEIIVSDVLSPTVAINRATSNVLLKWLVSATGFALEETSSLSPPITWSVVTTAPVPANGTNTVTLPLNKPMDYFRLHR